MKHLFIAILLIPSTLSVCSAQSDAAKNPAADDGDPRNAALDAVEAQYRELICSRAADFASPNQESAIYLAVKQNYVDERFNAAIRQVMEEASKPDQWDVEQLSRAVRLLPVCTLGGKERTELVFRCFLMCGEDKPDRTLERDLKRQLTLHPDETSRLVKERMSQKAYSPKLWSLVQIVGKSSQALLPQLLEVAESGDPELCGRAMHLISELIADIRKHNDLNRETALIKKLGLDPKLVNYAERIVSRYDTNRDSELTPAEFSKMLVSPAPADTDQNGLISVHEYAAWMQSRSKR